MRLLHLYHALFLSLASAQLVERYGAVPIDPTGLTPRYFLDKSLPFAKRAGTSCGDDKHSCLDVGFGDGCCDNDSYCYVNRSGDLKCCPIGSNCVDDSPCNSTAYFCTRTVTTGSTPVARPGCCGRRCPETSLFLCAASLGGGCCSYGADCRANGACAATKTASESNTLTLIAEGECTASQHKCADGTGCCEDGQHCTQVSGTGYCAPGNITESMNAVPDPDKAGLSNGAKAGIGIGAVVGASIIVGGLTWLCISHRRQHRRSLGMEDSGIGGDSVPVDEMEEASGTDGSRAARHGLTQDYFGPDAETGPFTETTAPFDTSPGQSRAVPTRPDGPGDITAAVEIDSRPREHPGDGFLSPHSNSSSQPTPQSETIDGRFELYGSEEREPLSIVPTPKESPVIKSMNQAE
ncbi:hypothetical protein BGZ63DRAFT_17395 [Mariannaea sp. PMI_226]|nr:hypothetical protein BGZ63DRAFT_17395 [Mariannaea sp. PMI_226]